MFTGFEDLRLYSWFLFISRFQLFNCNTMRMVFAYFVLHSFFHVVVACFCTVGLFERGFAVALVCFLACGPKITHVWRVCKSVIVTCMTCFVRLFRWFCLFWESNVTPLNSFLTILHLLRKITCNFAQRKIGSDYMCSLYLNALYTIYRN